MSTSAFTLPAGYALVEGYPAPEAYMRLRADSGLSPRTPAQAACYAAGSWHGVYITYADPSLPSPSPVQGQEPSPVGMGRILGDGSWYFVIADMAVLPGHQRKGLGDAILKSLLARIRERAPEGETYVSLMADPPGKKLYERNGFIEGVRWSEVGMVLETEEGKKKKV